jgi:hypothetical protein
MEYTQAVRPLLIWKHVSMHDHECYNVFRGCAIGTQKENYVIFGSIVRNYVWRRIVVFKKYFICKIYLNLHNW